MERTQRPEGGGEREQREALEQVQMELRAARATLQASGDVARAERAVQAAVVDATTRRDQEATHVAALKAQNRESRQRIEALEKRLVEKEKEEAVLARGAALRDQYVDWNPANPLDYERNKNGATVGEVKAMALVLGLSFLVLIIFLFATKR
jgi:hypothetical protein